MDESIFINSSEGATISDIPDEILLEIFKKLKFDDLCKCSGVCRLWYELARCMTLRKKIVVERPLKSLQVAQLVQQHFHKQLEEFQFLNGSNRPRKCVVEKVTFYSLRDTCPQLKKLVLVCCNMKYVSLQDMPEMLRCLSLRKCELIPYRFFKNNTEQYVPHLTCLDLGGVMTFLTSEDLRLLNRLKSLRCLYLESCRRITDGGIEAIVDLIRHLEILNVEATDISNEGAQIIIRNGIILKKLYMGFTRINDFVFDGTYTDMFLKLQNLCVRFSNVSLDIVEKLRKNNRIQIEFSRYNEDAYNFVSEKDFLANFFHICNHRSHSCPI